MKIRRLISIIALISLRKDKICRTISVVRIVHLSELSEQKFCSASLITDLFLIQRLIMNQTRAVDKAGAGAVFLCLHKMRAWNRGDGRGLENWTSTRGKVNSYSLKSCGLESAFCILVSFNANLHLPCLASRDRLPNCPQCQGSGD